ncbi:hypothetical protein HNP73_000449 [Amaricoccus macauensis]|uniref:Uncharacterized protein n=1 Tax=Amaricoccus macauensis TaxID=57001 RepID=A0A840SK51_9RHOB|nr:hypothetical protein [Amaricoccus macauensis]
MSTSRAEIAGQTPATDDQPEDAPRRVGVPIVSPCGRDCSSCPQRRGCPALVRDLGLAIG